MASLNARTLSGRTTIVRSLIRNQRCLGETHPGMRKQAIPGSNLKIVAGSHDGFNSVSASGLNVGRACRLFLKWMSPNTKNVELSVRFDEHVATNFA